MLALLFPLGQLDLSKEFGQITEYFNWLPIPSHFHSLFIFLIHASALVIVSVN